MKTNPKLALILLTLFGFLIGSILRSQAQPSLSVNPSVTSNSYTGFITLNITGLLANEQVTIRKYLDLNGNGAIDPGEPLVDAFGMRDGGAMVIGGVTNVSVPYDTNPTAGAITTSLNFAADLIIENMVGNYIYQLVSPTSRFNPVTATFTVTNGNLGQTISGTVYTNGVPAPNAVVVAQDEQANNPRGGIVADANGNFSLSLPASSYQLIAGEPGFYYDFSTGVAVNLTNGMNTSGNKLYLTNGGASTSISGKMYDSVTSNGIGGLLFTLQSGSLFAIGFTDTNGDYALPVTPSFWKVGYAKQRLARRAYVVPNSNAQVDTTGGSVSNANFPLFKGTALFYGRVTDGSNNPFPNVELDAGTGGNGNGSNLDAKGYSDANGYYGVVALGDQTNQWSCEINEGKGTDLANYVVNSFPTTNLYTNQAVMQNFVPLPALGQITGHAQDNSGNPVNGVLMMAGATINGRAYEALDSTTDNSGNFSIAVAAGTWDVHFETGGFSDNLDSKGLVDYTPDHYVSVPPTNVFLNLTVYPFGTPFLSQLQRVSSGTFAMTLTGTNNVSYTLQATSDLSSTNWTSLYSIILTNNPTMLFDNTASNAVRFYRVKKNQ